MPPAWMVFFFLRHSLPTEPRLALNLRSSCFYFPNASILGICHHVQLHMDCLEWHIKVNLYFL
jgi:hypothetical protein